MPIFTESDVSDIVFAVLDCPMTAPNRFERHSTYLFRRQTRQCIADFIATLEFAFATHLSLTGALDHLGHIWPAPVCTRAAQTDQRARFETTVRFADGSAAIIVLVI